MIFTGQIPYEVFLTLLAAARQLKTDEWKTNTDSRVTGLEDAIKQTDDILQP